MIVIVKLYIKYRLNLVTEYSVSPPEDVPIYRKL